MLRRRICWMLFWLVTPLVVSAAPADVNALDWAWRFASAIESDAKDRAAAQGQVFSAWVERADLERAAGHVVEVTGWPRGVAFAELATAYARRGEREVALAEIKRAHAVAKLIEDWPRERIQAQICFAHGALGDTELIKEMGGQLPKEEAVKATVALAIAQAVNGDEAAMRETLAVLERTPDYLVTWWRTQGWLAVARVSRLSRAQRLVAIEEAERAAATVPGWKQVEAYLAVAGAFHAAGEVTRVPALLDRATQVVDDGDLVPSIASPLLARVGAAQGRWGDRDTARRLLEQSQGLVDQLLTIERPRALAWIAGGWIAAGDPEKGERVYGTALDAAAALVNARPRALALVEICLSLSEHAAELGAERQGRLQALFAGLGDPW